MIRENKSVNSIFLILEGNMGAGKSTLLRIIKENLPEVEIIYEPTDKWQNVGKEGNILDLFYKDIKRWAYTFQSYAFITRIQSILEHKAKDGGTQILERSVFCDRYCFAKNCFESDNMSAIEWQMYKELFSWLVENYTQKPDGFIYLKTTPETCGKRILKRNRKEEEGVALEYLKTLHQKHEDWLVHKKEIDKNLKDVPVLTLDCNNDFEFDLKQREINLNAISQFIDEIKIKKIQNPTPQRQIQI